jgi:hypothetical protein
MLRTDEMASWGVLDSEDIQYGCASGLVRVATPDERIDRHLFEGPRAAFRAT